ncbi:MAG TPA: hypothetical protein VKM93_22030 [Terriglobia bacterium]|nr:hypothetical protein [Terriglobia bacterium]
MQLEKVLHSEVFRLAPGLQRFLKYIASKTIEGQSHEIKEYTIGSEVFDRPADYDPRIDTVVRVQAHRLREKLKEYYGGEGAGDDILLVIPKGHYVPSFSRRASVGNKAAIPEPSPGLSKTPEMAKSGPTVQPNGSNGNSWPRLGGESERRSLLWVLSCLTVAVLLSLGLALHSLRSGPSPEDNLQSRSGAAKGSPPTGLNRPLRDLWAGFTGAESSPIVTYSNTVFLATETSDLLRLKSEEVDNLGAPARADVASRLVANPRLLRNAGPVFFEDVYTGTGEVMAVFYLTRLFGELRSPLQVKRSRLVTTDDLSRHDVIFLGSTREDALLAGLTLSQDFVFAWPRLPEGVWGGQISNLHPLPGEQPIYEVERDPGTHVVRADYALVSFLPGVASNRRIAILGGLTTFGTQAAAEFATSPSEIAELAGRLETGPGASGVKAHPFFQAVLRAEIMKGDILSVKCVAVHAIHPAPNSPPKG